MNCISKHGNRATPRLRSILDTGCTIVTAKASINPKPAVNAKAQRYKGAKQKQMGLKMDRLGNHQTGGVIRFYNSLRLGVFVPLR
jgi:hypothetical protein